jgi:predicted aldo/keto reductase-like oxidoreductase
MQYRIDQKSGNKLSVLGFGAMRFTRNLTGVDLKKAETIILASIEKGVNYFDTAYVYPGCEEALGTILHRNDLRDKVFIATKLPVIQCTSYEDFDLVFNKQLERLKTDHIDYYLIHNLQSVQIWRRLCDLGIEKWIALKKKSGAIGNIGFSFHGAQKEFLKLLNEYKWEFCQIQYNYLNINYQAGELGLKKAAEMGLPVIVMEPLLGGKLVNGLPKKAQQLLQSAKPVRTPATWGLSWLWNQPEVTLVLSGMNEMEQLEENAAIAESSYINMLSEQDHEVVNSVIDIVSSAYKIPCTSCNYCMPCPSGVDIPGSFTAYNTSYAIGYAAGIQQYLTSVNGLRSENNRAPSLCVNCGRCETFCPQKIQIIDSLTKVKQRMEPVWSKPIIFIARKYMNRDIKK